MGNKSMAFKLFLLGIFFSTNLFANIQDFRKILLRYKNDQNNMELLSRLLDSYGKLNTSELKRAELSLSNENLKFSDLRDKYSNYLIDVKRQQTMAVPVTPVVEKIVKTKVDVNSEAAKVLDDIRQEFIILANKMSTLRAMKESPAALFPKMLIQIEEMYKKLKNIKKISNSQLLKEKNALEEVLENMHSDLSQSKNMLKEKYKQELSLIEVPSDYSKEERQVFDSLVQARIDILNFFNQLSGGNITSKKENELALVLKEVASKISKLKYISNSELKKQKEEIELLVKDYSQMFKVSNK